MKAFIFFISITLGLLFSTIRQAKAISDEDGISYTIRVIEPNKSVELDNIMVTFDGNRYGLNSVSIPYNKYLNRETLYSSADLLCFKIGFPRAIKYSTPKAWKEQFKEKNWIDGVTKYRLAYLDNQGRIGHLSEQYNHFINEQPVIKSVICQK